MHTATPRWPERLSRPLVGLLRQPLIDSMLRLGAVEDSLAALHPMLSLTEVRARVLRVSDETGDTKTVWLRPNLLWRGARAGQYVRLRAEINGRRVERVYSLSSRPGDKLLALTVKRQGLMSTHLHEQVRAGEVLTISQAMGDFVLPDAPPPKLLMLSAGSGITPLMAMLRELQARRHTGSIDFVQVCRRPEELIFAAELQAATRQLPGLKLHLHYSAVAGRFDVQTLRRLVPDLAERPTWLCGPAALMDEVHALWALEGFAAPLHSERFAAAPLRPAKALGTPVTVVAERSTKTFESSGTANLLEQAEAAGLNPKHGCRIGICASCQCVKRSGTVQNLQTGELCSAPDQTIRLCISAARSELALDL
jgi:ferredoxin-NADP reductase